MKCYVIMSEDNLLPDVTETDIFSDYEKNPSDYIRCLYWLYVALSKREKYYEKMLSYRTSQSCCK